MARKFFWALAAVSALLSGCVKHNPEMPDSGQDGYDEDVLYYANLFGYNIMSLYYLWHDEVEAEYATWTFGSDPVEKVEQMRYRDASGKEVDRWTRMLPDYHGFLGSVTGNTNSFGLDFVLYYADSSRKKVAGVVTFTYPDSPARRAGSARGDVFLTLNGAEMTPDNYSEIINSTIYGGGTVTLGFRDGRSFTLVAEAMYENPVQSVSVLVSGNKKVGYLHYSGFTLNSCEDLIPVFQTFKDEGIRELVVDLRYNGGGYAMAATILGSMIAPPDVVAAGKVFNKDIYNKRLTKEFGDENSCFAETFAYTTEGRKVTVNPGSVNPGVDRVWFITSGNTASASESLICGLKPYMDVRTVGQRTYGKFCGGYLITADSWYESLSKEKSDVNCTEALNLVADWGIYVIATRYTDCNGVTLSMPDGIPADYDIQDDPLDGYPLGDPSETMLARVLSEISGTKAPSPASSAAAPVPLSSPRPAGFGVRILSGQAAD